MLRVCYSVVFVTVALLALFFLSAGSTGVFIYQGF